MAQQTEFIPYEQALELKELGFDEECLDVYNMHGKLWGMRLERQSIVDSACSAPLYQQAFRWFREKYGLHFLSYSKTTFESYLDDEYPEEIWICRILSNTHFSPNKGIFVNTENGLLINHFHSYEEAELACLKKLIEIIKNK
jgi:hypothetical protein